MISKVPKTNTDGNDITVEVGTPIAKALDENVVAFCAVDGVLNGSTFD